MVTAVSNSAIKYVFQNEGLSPTNLIIKDDSLSSHSIKYSDYNKINPKEIHLTEPKKAGKSKKKDENQKEKKNSGTSITYKEDLKRW